MEEEFVSYEQAVAFKELGFDEECFRWYFDANLFTDEEVYLIDNEDNEEFAFAPLKQQVFRWFRVNYGIYSVINYNLKFNGWVCEWRNKNENFGIIGSYNTYEEAENACIDKLIELTKK